MSRLHCAAFRSNSLLHWLAGSSVASTGTSFHLFPFVSVQSWCAEMVHRSLPNMLLCVFLLFCLAGSSVASTGTSFHLFPFISICFRLFPCIRGVLRFCTDCFGTYCYLFFPLLHCVVSCRCPLLSHCCGFLTVSISTLTKPSNNAVTHTCSRSISASIGLSFHPPAVTAKALPILWPARRKSQGHAALQVLNNVTAAGLIHG